MKAFIWKILAISSILGILIGSFGPQIKAGDELLQPQPTFGYVEDSSLPVVDSIVQPEVVVVSASEYNCSNTALQLGRFDLVLWQSCAKNIRLGTISTSPIKVAVSNNELPKVVVKTEPAHIVTSNYKPWTAPDKTEIAFLSVARDGTPERISSIYRESTEQSGSSSQVIFSQAKTSNTIVMRC